MEKEFIKCDATEGEEEKGISRRDLLKLGAFSAIGAVGVAGAGGLTGCIKDSEAATETADLAFEQAAAVFEPITASEISETKDYDVVVVGAGAAGVPAALSARELGAKVAVLQKESTAVSQGNKPSGFLLDESDPAGPAYVMQQVNALNGHRANLVLLNTWAQKSGEALQWVAKRAGEGGFAPIQSKDKLGDFTQGVGVSLQFADFGPKPLNEGDGMRALAKTAEKDGVEFFYSTPGVQLVKEDDRVVAVIGRTSAGKYIRFNAKKGVILATGDYQNNSHMVATYLPDVEKFYKKQSNRTGDGHLMGMMVDAVMEPIPHTKMLHDFDSGPVPYGEAPFLRVNMNGERFMNEEVGMSLTNNYCRNQPDTGRYCQIFDANHAQQSVSWGGPPLSEDAIRNFMPSDPGTHTAVYKSLINTHKADTLADLAKALEVPADALQKTVEEYNKVCELGHDSKFGKRPKYLKPIAAAPFYGIKRRLGVSAIVSGLIINENSQCLDSKGKIIPGLYAAGNCSGPFYGGVDYPLLIGGLSLGRCHTFGRIAGQYVAKA